MGKCPLGWGEGGGHAGDVTQREATPDDTSEGGGPLMARWNGIPCFLTAVDCNHKRGGPAVIIALHCRAAVGAGRDAVGDGSGAVVGLSYAQYKPKRAAWKRHAPQCRGGMEPSSMVWAVGMMTGV